MQNLETPSGRRIKMLAAFVLAGISLGLMAMTGRLVYINSSLAPRLTAMVRAQQIGSRVVPARRGFIFDRAGRVIAGSRNSPGVYADPVLVQNVDDAAALLSPILDLPTTGIVEMLTRRPGQRFCWLKRRMVPADADAVRALGLAGVGVQYESDRLFPLESLMSPTIGIVGRDGVGLEGIEAAYDEHLRGRDGVHTSVYDGRRRRRPVWMDKELSRPEQDGGHVVLTLDAVIQGYLETELAAAVKECEAAGAVGVVMSPKTGAILALGQYPTFDPNRFSDVPADRRRNRAICDAVEPGSIFKPFVACGALLAGVVDTKEQIFCHEGLHYFEGRRIRDTSPHGLLTIEGIVAKSSNIGMGILGHRMGNEAIFRIVRAFGFGEPTGVGFPGDAEGMVHPLARWTRYSTNSVPIGQEITVSPLQIATAFCAIVNGGVLLRPYLVEKLLDPAGAVVDSFEGPYSVRRVLPEPLSDYMRKQVLPAVVETAGGSRAKLVDWRVGGKTGTAQVPFADRRGYEPGAYIGSFIGAAPVEDPEIVVLVMTHRPNPSKGYYGGVVSAPAVGKVLSQTLSYLQVPASPGRGETEVAQARP